MHSQPSASPRPAKEFVATQRRIYETAETGPADGFLFPPDPSEDLILSVLDLTRELERLGVIEIHQMPSGADAYRIVKKAKFGQGQSPEGELARRVGAIFGRRTSTQWAEDEIKAFKMIKDFGDLELVERFYKSEAKKPEGYCRTSVLTFLRHYPGEVDRAKRWQQTSARRHSY